MKISVNWLKQFTAIDLSIDELVQKIGAQLGAVEEVIDLGAKYKGIVIARVVSCNDHPNADRLHVCTIDDGGITPDVKRDENGYVQVVCGAPNVREGLTVAWLPPGSTVPSSYDNDPFVLEARELRGVVSNGMLASAKELAIGEDHDGIVEIDIDAAPGTPFAEVYQLDDYIIDVENKMFTHRPDCFGILGVAREIAGIQQQAFVSPDWYLHALDRIRPGKHTLPLVVKNEATELVPRLMAIAISDVTVGASPLTIQTYLSRVGIRPINNIVDITNYLMVLTGQPLHAYDYDKVKARSADTPAIIARTAAKDAEKLALLNGKTVALEHPAIVIATDAQVIGVGGIMGGADTEVDRSTTNIIIECANFDMYSIRKTSMRYGLFTDAVTRFNKGQSPLQNDRVLEEAVAMVQALSGAEIASDVFDINETTAHVAPVKVTAAFVNERLGLQLSAEQMRTLLENVEFAVHGSGDELEVTVPFWRTDIEIAEDIVEEVGRLWGFDHLPLRLPQRDLTPAARDPYLSAKTKARDVLSRAGANEALTYSFVHGNLLKRVGQDEAEAYRLSNAISPDLQYFRLSLTPSLLEKIHPNLKAGYDEFALFEINKSHSKKRLEESEVALPKEHTAVALVYVASDKKAASGAAYYQARLYLDTLAAAFGLELTYEHMSGASGDAMTAPFDPARSARVRVKGMDITLGYVGEYRQAVRSALKLPVRSAGFEVDLTLLSTEQRARPYQPLPRFPKVTQDISLRVRGDVAHTIVRELLERALAKAQPDKCAVQLEPLDIYRGSDGNRHFSFRYTIASYERTLTADEVNSVLDKAASVLSEQMDIERI